MTTAELREGLESYWHEQVAFLSDEGNAAFRGVYGYICKELDKESVIMTTTELRKGLDGYWNERREFLSEEANEAFGEVYNYLTRIKDIEGVK